VTSDPKTDRRPIATRNAGWAQSAAHRLAASCVTPNQISMASMAFATMAGAAFWAGGAVVGWAGVPWLVLAAVGCQARLICNLLDGMVAMEGGKKEPSGPFWNEFPDRVADIVILGGAGLGAGHPALGFAAASMAVFTAYVRELGRATGAPADFSGPMAKPQRMAVMTIAAAIAAMAVTGWWQADAALRLALWIVLTGAALTVLRRAVRLIAWLNRRE
jgi:phosphatidylglycerophosphate synthase